MRYFKKIILVVIMSAFICLPIKAEMTLKELFFDESKPFHLKILDVIPEEGIAVSYTHLTLPTIDRV